MTTPTYVRRGKFAVSLDGTPANMVEFDCAPNSITITPAAGDAGTPVEVLCGDTVAASVGPTTWTLDLSSIQKMETANTEADSFLLWALANDGATTTFWFQPSPTGKIFTSTATVVAIPIGGEVGGAVPLSEISWPVLAKPTIVATWPAP